MTGEEALKFFYKLPNRIPLKALTEEYIENYDEAYMVVKEAIEKQKIAKKLKEEEFFDIMRRKNVKRIVCPICGTYFTLVEFESEKVRIFEEHKCVKHCIECGQKLDWSND